MKTKNPHIGESFDSFLKDVGLHDAVMSTAIKRTLALQIEREMGFRGHDPNS